MDWVRQDTVIDILRGEKGHRRLFEGYGFRRDCEVDGLACRLSE